MSCMPLVQRIKASTRCKSFFLANQGNLVREKQMQDDPATLQRQHAVQGLLLGGARQPDARYQGRRVSLSLRARTQCTAFFLADQGDLTRGVRSESVVSGPQGKHADVQGLPPDVGRAT